jgi:hypothetical protein
VKILPDSDPRKQTNKKPAKTIVNNEVKGYGNYPFFKKKQKNQKHF